MLSTRINRPILLALFFLLFATKISSSKQLQFSGRFRNDFSMYEKAGLKYNNIVESRIELRAKTDKWKFYADGRAYYNSGEITKITNKTTFSLLRSFVRYYPSFGNITLGKTYINFGNRTIFNPFEIDKSLTFSDLKYAKEGIPALSIYISLGELSGTKWYISPEEDAIKSGLSLFTQIAGFDVGVVVNHNNTNQNFAGVYFKGDLLLGVNGAINCHFDDKVKQQFVEASFGIDYSFNDFVVTLAYYFNSSGTDDPTQYSSMASDATFLMARHYLFYTIAYRFNEFLHAELNSFINLNDKSSIWLPQVSYNLAEALEISIQFSWIIGKSSAEFSKEKFGKWGTLFRVQTKF